MLFVNVSKAFKHSLHNVDFQAKYTFETEYKIPGTAAPDGSCSFTYRSTSRKKGEFNSPRFPSKYISGMHQINCLTNLKSIHYHLHCFIYNVTGTNCSYKFLATPNEQVTILFDHFKVKTENANTTTGYYGYELSLSKLKFTSKRESKIIQFISDRRHARRIGSKFLYYSVVKVSVF